MGHSHLQMANCKSVGRVALEWQHLDLGPRAFGQSRLAGNLQIYSCRLLLFVLSVLRTSPSVLPMLTNLFRRGRIKVIRRPS